MSSRIRHLTFDCIEPYAQAQFWSAALGYIDGPANPNAPGDPEAVIIDPRGLHPGLLFLPVPEPKTVKNRLHLDLVPAVGRDVEVDELLAIGATLVDDRRNADGTGWVVLADPEGNELCIERAEAERPDHTPPVEEDERPMLRGLRTADERTMLQAMLEWYRAGVVRKVRDLAAHHAVATPLGSATSIAGLVKHLALVEDAWFHTRFAGHPDPEPWAGIDWDVDPDWEFHSAADDALEDLVAAYEASCERSRQAAAGHSLDELAAAPPGEPFVLRYAYVHMIDETARHLGHLDILRELQDGATGD